MEFETMIVLIVAVACGITVLSLIFFRKRIVKKVADRVAGTDTAAYDEKSESEIEHDIRVKMEAILR